jgi:YbgC/YbaW family acyl-CoA thioester hydrolase
MAHHFDRATLLSTTDVRYRHAFDVRFQDVDAAGIVFFARILAYFHDAYFAWLMNEGGVDLPSAMREGEVAMPVAHQSCDFLRPLFFGDHVEAQVTCVVVEEMGYSVGLRMVRGETVTAVGQLVLACVDRASFQRRPLPEDFAAFLRGNQRGETP